MGAGCNLAQDTTETTRSSISTTNGWCKPNREAGYGCSNGMGVEADVHGRQKPTEAKPQPSLANEKFQSPLSRPYTPCGRKRARAKGARTALCLQHGQ